MENKVCSKCKIEKTLDNFSKKNNGYSYYCKECSKQYMKEYYKLKKDDEEFRNKRKKYLNNYIRPQESIERHKQKTKEWRKRNKEHIKEYARNYDNEHLEEKRANYNNWKNKNKDKVKIYQQKDYERRKNNSILKMKRNIRNLINDSFKKHKYRKNKYTEEILGCKVDEFILHLLETFKINYGYEWNNIEPVHIDHIIPLSTAKTEEDVIRLCHYTNLQLLKAKDNMSKSDKLDWKLH